MNNIDVKYQRLLKEIIEEGIEKKDRTGTGTLSLFGKQIVHDMSEGFPLLTTKKMYFKGIIIELLWFLRGDTNIRYLIKNDCNIWNGDCYKNYCTKTPDTFDKFTKEEFINLIKTREEFALQWGELGPIYGKQWRNLNKQIEVLIPDYLNAKEFQPFKYKKEIESKQVDQIRNLIFKLIDNPDDRRLIVNSWNALDLEEMVLPPCHYSFQLYTKKLNLEQRKNLAIKLIPNELPQNFHDLNSEEEINEILDDEIFPTRTISLLWNQRSVDTFLGLPFNIASYALLLEIIGKIVNMIPDKLIGNLGDTHLYLNHIEQAKEQIERIPFDLPYLKIENESLEDYNVKEKEIDKIINSLQIDNFNLLNYQSHEKIFGELSN